MPKSSAAPESSAEYTISALEAGLQVLALVGQFPELKIPQLATRAGMTRSKVYRILQTLARLGYVWFDDEHAVRLGSASLILGQQAREQYSLNQAARPILDRLADETGENIHLVVREGQHSLVVDVRTSPHPVRMFARIGRVGPLHAGGSSKVLLAYAPRDVLDAILSRPLERFTAGTITDAAALEQALRHIREDGTHVAISDLEEDTFSIAAPIFDDQGQAVASVSIAGPLMRLDPNNQERYLGLIREASRELSERLGFSAGLQLAEWSATTP
ncbi:IclR family transcriptional regulator [Deinococcus apachensis]|uniref:IclR family transcriptional regulator n=1 Tax=Deinococcus apachensis TaxID=309886 RepID=UPI0003812FFC|nr:IclR family transcriptional regulator [Deinococcus apachensis]